MNNRVVVAMSGGVDSTVAAILLKNQGYDIIGVTMDTGYGNAVEEAAMMCDFLHLKHYVVDVKKDFAQEVVGYFVNSYLAGETPNPCVVCNKKIKFSAFFPLMAKLKADYFATGHYVKKIASNGRELLYKAKYKNKDQSYFLYSLSQKILSKCLFPLAEYTKDEIRAIAAEFSLPVAIKKDSQDVCFIIDNDYRQFIKAKTPKAIIPGNIINSDGQVVGKHQGLAFYTVGQRKGLGLSLGYPAYVLALNTKDNSLLIGKEDELYAKEALLTNCNFLPFDELNGELVVEVKVRYRGNSKKALIVPAKEHVRIIFAEPEKSVTIGQSAVFYNGEQLIGGGKIAQIQK